MAMVVVKVERCDGQISAKELNFWKPWIIVFAKPEEFCVDDAQTLVDG